jgi:hypothetical protein
MAIKSSIGTTRLMEWSRLEQHLTRAKAEAETHRKRDRWWGRI